MLRQKRRIAATGSTAPMSGSLAEAAMEYSRCGAAQPTRVADWGWGCCQDRPGPVTTSAASIFSRGGLELRLLREAADATEKFLVAVFRGGLYAAQDI
jgi:hypothetical protein